MSLECGIVGLPNVGKSTLFNTLTSASVAAENFPFCTVDPNRGIVDVPDPRLHQLVEIVQPKKSIPATMTFVDIAGLVKGASSGEGLGNQFLAHIREVDAVVHLVRCFEDENIAHIMGEVDPQRDIEIIDLELCLADSELAQKKAEKLAKQAKSANKDAKTALEQMTAVQERLGAGVPLRRLASNSAQAHQDDFVTAKPLMYLANLHEEQVKNQSPQTQKWLDEIKQAATKDDAKCLALSASLEYQLSQISDPEDKALFFEEYGLVEPGLNRLIRESYELLGLITFFTAGEKEVRAWTIPRGSTAQEAAGKIHSDFARGFIRAEVIHFDDYIGCGGEKVAREKGLQRSEGKDYIVQDGDVILFRFNV